MTAGSASALAPDRQKRPRLGFAGTGWIGRARLEAVTKSGLADVHAIFDPNHDCAEAARQLAPDARITTSFERLLEQDLDGIVIATPSALHAEQTSAALKRGLAVFCQKPLARDHLETQRVVETARSSDRLLAVDLSYRYTDAIAKMRELVAGGALGKIYAADLVFHNAYGPDKDWYYHRALSGGGCVIDLGIHLVDLALWMLDWPTVLRVQSSLYSQGNLLHTPADSVEDYAVATIVPETGATIRIACSWKLPTRGDAVIAANLYGTAGGVEFHNVDGSFYDFAASYIRGRERITLASPPDAWGGRALLAWISRLSKSSKYDPQCEKLIEVARTLDLILKTQNG